MPKIFGYKITEQISTNHQLFVVRGIRVLDQKTVILKGLATPDSTPAQIDQINYEYEITKRLNIPGTIKVLEILNQHKNPILVFEDMGGISLQSYLFKNKMELGLFLQLAIQLAQTLGELHQHGIIHKDIKPSNIILHPETFEIKLTDFAIASQLTKESPTISHSNLLEGSLAYMSPEQTGRMNRSIDYRTDFYSLGVTFYEMLTGQLPCDSDDSMELVHCHIARIPIPPNQVNPQIPQVVSDLIMKLLAKTAEDRYQSGFGLKIDLEKCLKQWQEKGEILEFTLATQDFSGQLQIPQKLYGREQELAKLLVAFERVCLGKTELMLIAGYSGIGKSALVQEIQKPLVRYRGYFISGKFDQFQRNIPYSSLIQAFSELMRQLLTETDWQIQTWKEKLLAALGANGQIIIDVIPEVELIIGKQPPVPQLGATETQNRFNLFLKNFIHVFTQKEHPLVLFLDDLQWADLASLKLIQLLMTESDSKYLLLIGAYRDNEVDATHPLMMALDEMQKSGASVNKITLQPLEITHINQLISDTFNCPDPRLLQEVGDLKALAELVFNKTNGNPFFLTQLLKSLHQENLLNFDFSQGVWQWDIERLQAVGITDNVVDLMISQIQKLSEATQNILKLAACVGNRFSLEVLAVVYEKSIPDTAAELREAVQAGLIISESNIYKIPITNNEPLTILYKFLHDRVQQAAYSLIPENRKKEAHLKIGRLLLQQTASSALEETIFDIVNQLNIGREFITQSSEKKELAQLNLKAGKKAKAATAYEAAVKYLTVGLELLPEDSWQNNYESTLNLYVEAAEAEYLNTNFERAEMLSEIVLRQAQILLDKVKVYELKIQFHVSQYQLEEALTLGLSVMEMLGVTLYPLPSDGNLVVRLPELWDLGEIPSMTDVNKLAVLRIFINIVAAALMTAPTIYVQLTLTMIDICIRYGGAAEAAYVYANYGLILCSSEYFEAGYRAGQIAIVILEQFHASSVKCKVYAVFNAFIRHWKEPARETISSLQEAIESGRENGDYEYVGYCFCHIEQHLFLIGKPLELVEENQSIALDLMRRIKQEQTRIFIIINHQMVLNLQGSSSSKEQLIGSSFDESTMLPYFQSANLKAALFLTYLAKLILSYFFKNYTQALENADAAQDYANIVMGKINFVAYNFYYSLALIARYDRVNPAEQKQYLLQVEVNQQKMQNWAYYAPANYQHKYDLVEAEKAQVLGQNWQAMEYYDRAITGAREQGYIQEEALAYELAAEFYQKRGRNEISQTYMKKAHNCYLRWGAFAKVQDLESRYPYLVSKIATLNSTKHITNNSTNSTSKNILDLATVIKASQAIASEIELDNLLAKLMRTVLENAGAQSGVLILNREGQFIIEGTGTVEPEQILVRQSIPVEGSDRVPLSIINYVARTQEDVILNQAIGQGNFINDPYIITHQTKSLLCTSILSQGKLIGILYLENNLVAGAFTPERTQLLKLLYSQAAISLENAQLYEVQKEYTKTLERQVQERTQELQQQKAWFDGFFAASSAAFSIVDKELQFIQINEAMAEINGVPLADHFGKKLGDVLPHLASILVPTYEQILTTGEPLLNYEVSGETASQPGLQRHWIVSNFPLFGTDGKPMGVGAVVVEISDRKQAEAALQQAKEAADAASRAKGEFLSKMSHELRTPLNAILGFSQILNRDLSLTSQQQEYLGIINRAGEHLLTLINDVLEMSKIEAGRIDLHETTFDLYHLLNSLQEMFQLRAESKGLKLILTLAPEVPQYVQTDESKLRQIVINLLGNAIKFTETGSVTLRVRAVMGNGSDSSNYQLPITNYQLYFEVEDTGSGIAPEDIDTLFEAFVQTAAGKKSQSGTGLGLPISRQFIHLMGGEITVSSRLNQGSIFNFDIPIKLPEAITVSTPTATRVIGLEPNQSPSRILVVEDQSESRLLLVSLLTQVGFEVREAINGQAGVLLAESWQPHLIWMDMQMPVMNGYEATRQIRARERQNSEEHLLLPITHTIIIALTANAFAEDKAAVLSAGCDDFVSKPFREEVIFDKIAQYLEVRYIYEQIALPKAQQPTEDNLAPELFQGVPPEWIVQLYQAAIELDDEQVGQLSEQIRESHPLLADTLAKFTKKLRFDTITEAIKKL